MGLLQTCHSQENFATCHKRSLLQVMSHIPPDDLFLKLAGTMVDGVPNLLNTELLSKEVASLLATPNLPTVAKNPELVDKAILKEERNHLSMVFSSQLTAFTPNLGIIKLGILDKKRKKPRMYRHGSYISKVSKIQSTRWSTAHSANRPLGVPMFSGITLRFCSV